MNIDMRIAHGDPGGGKDLLHPVEHIVIARPIILCARPEAQDILDRAVAVGDDVRLDRPVAERLSCAAAAAQRAARTLSAASS